MSDMRDRFRTQIRDEVKAAALRQLAAGGPQALSINAIAKELGVSGPALYRYFAGRELAQRGGLHLIADLRAESVAHVTHLALRAPSC